MLEVIDYETARKACCEEGLHEFMALHGLTEDSTITVPQLIALARESTPEWRGQVARYAPGLSPDQRFELARESTPFWRALLARDAPGLSSDQRMALARECDPFWREPVARFAPGLSAEQREELRNL